VVNPVRIVAVGGLGEVGRNMALLSVGDTRIVVDCGVGFPRDRGATDAEQLLPDVAAVSDQPLAAVVLTHGHDDHIAAVGHLIRTGVPIGRIVGMPFTIELLRAKLAPNVPLPPVSIAAAGRPVRIDDFAFEYVRVAHSIPDAAAVAISTPVGVVVFTGDYKMDDTQARVARRADKVRLAALGQAGVLAMLGDSTYAEVAGRTPSEDSTIEPLRRVVESVNGRVVVTCFASNIDRVDHATRAADATGRSVTLIGRSMRRNTMIAERLGEMAPALRPTVPPRDLATLRPRRSMVICTGSQAETNAVLARSARGEHPDLVLTARDTVVFASRPVPGNERDVETLMAALSLRGCSLITHHDAPIHVSGHARGDEIGEMINLLQPRFVIPVHGEHAMLEAQARIAVARGGVDRERVVLARCGDVIEITTDTASIVDHIPVRVIEADANGEPIERGFNARP
jgi:ribonuclease J